MHGLIPPSATGEPVGLIAQAGRRGRRDVVDGLGQPSTDLWADHRLDVPGGRPALRAVADALPGQSLTVFLALIATGAIALGAIAFGGLGGTPAEAAVVQNPQSVHAAHGQDALSATEIKATIASLNTSTITPNSGLVAFKATPDKMRRSEAGEPVADETPSASDSSAPSIFTSGSPEPSPPAPDLSTARSVQVSPGDIVLLDKVRQANLWEIPTTEQAQVKAASPIVKKVALQLHADHLVLDQVVQEFAQELNVVLPSQPNTQQQGFMADLATKNGDAYDRTMVNDLRQAHGGVFNVIAQVRTSTRNPLIRLFAQTANVAVQRHMTLLESTGLVDYSQLPVANISAAAAAATYTNAFTKASPGARTVLFVAMLAAATLIGTASIRRVRTGR